MPGIAGILNLSEDRPEDDVARKMAGSLELEGPSGYRDENLVLFAPDEKLFIGEKTVAALKGFVYNVAELKKSLREKGYSFRSQKDAEVVQKLYLEEGDEFVNMLDGDFLVVIYDQESENIRAYTDRKASRDFFYFENGGKLVFGSRLVSVLSYPFDWELDYRQVNWMANYTPLKHSRTAVQGVSRMQTREKLVFGGENVEKKKYCPVSPRSVSKLDLDRVDRLMKDAIEKRVEKLNPESLGVYLSGGIDSATALGYLRKVYPEREITAYTAASPEFDHSRRELEAARKNAESFGVDHEVVTFEGKNIEELSEWTAIRDMRQVTFTKGLLGKAVSEDEVVLNGVGLEPLFTTDSIRFNQKLWKFSRSTPRIVKPYLKKLGRKTENLQARALLGKMGSSDLSEFFMSSQMFFDHFRPVKGSLPPLDMFEDLNDFRELSFELSADNDSVSKPARYNGAEAFTPFLDDVLVNYMMSVPSGHLERRGGRQLLRKNFETEISTIETKKSESYIAGALISPGYHVMERRDYVKDLREYLGSLDRFSSERLDEVEPSTKREFRLLRVGELVRTLDRKFLTSS